MTEQAGGSGLQMVRSFKGIPPWPPLKLSEQQLGGRDILEKPVTVIFNIK